MCACVDTIPCELSATFSIKNTRFQVTFFSFTLATRVEFCHSIETNSIKRIIKRESGSVGSCDLTELSSDEKIVKTRSTLPLPQLLQMLFKFRNRRCGLHL